MQNEPNFQKSQMFITVILTTNYSEKSTLDTWSKRTQTKPILSRAQPRDLFPLWPAMAGKIAPLFRVLFTLREVAEAALRKIINNQSSIINLKALLQLDGPVGVVEELLPATVARMAEVDVDKRIAFRLDGLSDKGEAGLLWGSASLYHVTICAGADHIFPV